MRSVNQRQFLRQATNQKTSVQKPYWNSASSFNKVFNLNLLKMRKQYPRKEWFLYRIPISVGGFMSICMKKAIVFPCHKSALKIQGYEEKQDMWCVQDVSMFPFDSLKWKWIKKSHECCMQKVAHPISSLKDTTLDIESTSLQPPSNVKANSTAQEFAEDAIHWCLCLHHDIPNFMPKSEKQLGVFCTNKTV